MEEWKYGSEDIRFTLNNTISQIALAFAFALAFALCIRRF
jgi:hypothetical protein